MFHYVLYNIYIDYHFVYNINVFSLRSLTKRQKGKATKNNPKKRLMVTLVCVRPYKICTTINTKPLYSANKFIS